MGSSVRWVSRGVAEACYWDTAEPNRYLPIDSRQDFDYAIYRGKDHQIGQREDTEEPYQRLEADLARIVGSVEITYRWSGQVIETANGIAYIGETAEKALCGDRLCRKRHNLLEHSVGFGDRRFAGRKNPWTELFGPHRKKRRGGAWDYCFYHLRVMGLLENKHVPAFQTKEPSTWFARSFFAVRLRISGVER